MAVAPKCDVCSDAHWPHQAHRFAKSVPVKVAAEVDVGGVLASTDGFFASCEVCGEEFYPKRSDARFCSAKCRQASSRKRRAK